MKGLYAQKWGLPVANVQEFAAFLRELRKIHGFAVIALGVILFGLQAMVFVTPKQVITSPPYSPTTKLGRETYPAPGIIGLVCLTAGVAMLVTRPRANGLLGKSAA